MTIRLLLADDQAMVRGALVALLSLEPDLEVVAEVGRGDEVVAAALASRPDVCVLDYRMRRLKELGVNAIRCSHNAQDKRFYELCDELGFLVMDENRMFNTAPEHMDELVWLVRCHRNHPSIILWSVFNEEPMQATEQGYEMVRRMTAAVRQLDTSRPVTAATNT